MKKIKTIDDDLYSLDWWRTYSFDNIIELMNETKINIKPNSDFDSAYYYWPCEDNENCTNSTWVPLHCLNSNVSCANAIQWLPEYTNNGEDRTIINDYELKLQINYLGGEWVESAQQLFEELFNNNWRVLYSIWSPSTWVSSNEFSLIGYPLDYAVSQGEKLFKLLPTRLQKDNVFAFDLLDSILMSDDQYETILFDVWNQVGIYETSQSRAIHTCNWLRNNTDSWTRWIPDVDDC